MRLYVGAYGLFLGLIGLIGLNCGAYAGQQTIRGRLRILHSDNFKTKQHTAIYLLVSMTTTPAATQKRYEIHFKDDAAASLKNGEVLSVTGEVSGSRIDHATIVR